jgi:2-methylaconitate cis-trans-isomerase PrpF
MQKRDSKVKKIRIGHPFGIMEVGAKLEDAADGGHKVKSGILGRTARRIMEGYVYVRN